MCEVWLLAAQKPINRPSRWEGKFALFQLPIAGGWGEVDVCPKSDPHPTPGNQWGKSFYRQRDGVVGAATCRNRTVSSMVTFRWVISGLTSDVLIVLGTVKPSVPGSICSHFLVARSWNCGRNCPGYSLVIMNIMYIITPPPAVSRRQLAGQGSGVLPTALEKELKVLDYA